MDERLRICDDFNEMGGIKDWRKALRSRPAYRVVNRTLKNQTQFITLVTITGFVVLCVLYSTGTKKEQSASYSSQDKYNYTYPLTRPIITNLMHTFRIGIVADLDTNSKSSGEKHSWVSYLKRGYLSYSPSNRKLVVAWDSDPQVQLKTNFALKDRGMELSELVVFDGKLLSFDDRTGVVFHIDQNAATPWLLLMDGNGKSTKGFKSEWATVKNKQLYVGSMGKEWTTPSGEFSNTNPMYIKIIDINGRVNHVNWEEHYKRIREVLNISWPGYMIHESGVWSEVHQRWFFLPRRCSQASYNETLDELRGCSYLISATDDMFHVQTTKILNSKPSRGFSSFKFVPTSEDTVIVALRTEELDGKTATYLTAFHINGEILLDDTYIDSMKYEGIEFI